MALYLGIPSESGIDWDTFGVAWWQIVPYLQLWLRQGNSAHRSVPVYTIDSPRGLTVWDTLVYLVGDPDSSVVLSAGAPERGEGGLAGQTSTINGEWISEVFVNAHSAYGIAATVIHEMLHNRFEPFYDIHRTPGNFTSASAPYSRNGPNEFDLKLISVALTVPRRQYQGGF